MITLGPSNLPGLQGGLTTYGTTTLGISWTTNTFTECQINYGTAQSYGLTVSESTYFTSHTLSLNSLTPNTDYYYEIVCNDGFGHNTNSGNLIASTKDTTTLAQLASAFGGHIGQAMSDINVPTQYAQGNVPAYAVVNGEINTIVLENSGKWPFCCTNSAGQNYSFADIDFQLAQMPSLQYRWHNIVWNSAHPLGLNPSAGTWQADIAYRLNTLSAWAKNWGSQWQSIDVINEAFTNTPPYQFRNTFYNFGGPTWFYQPFNDFVSIGASTNVRLGSNDFGNGENSYNWGAATTPFPKFAVQGDKPKFENSIEFIQQYLQTGGRFDMYGFEMHLNGAYMLSDVDLKWVMYEVRRLGLVPEVHELNCNYNNTPGGVAPPLTKPQAQQYCANYSLRILYDWMIYGGLKDIIFWTNVPTRAGQIEEGLWWGNQKTPLFHGLATLFKSVTPATSWPTAHRLNFTLSLPPAAVTTQTPGGSCSSSSCTGMIGTPGLITVPWTEFVYRTGPVQPVNTFSQSQWTFDYQFYTQGSTGGNIFEAVDGSNNQLILINWNATSGNVTVAIDGAAPVVVGKASQNAFHGLAITKINESFSLCLDGGIIFTTTATIAAIANLEWLDNTGTGTLAQQVNVTTFDVYEASSILTGSALQSLSVFADNSPILTFADINNWVIPSNQ